MVLSIKKIFILLISILLSTGSTIFLDASLLIKTALFFSFMIINFIAISNLIKIKNLKDAVAEDVKKKIHIHDEVLGSVVGMVWLLQMPENLSPLESTTWILTNTICLISTLYVVHKIIRVIFHS